ncbi:ABC transporter substrate-binding protein [Alteromonas flava]|uniref:ABC transporter substrate-binding protein n=1 Tax=Alteromonas flava TaxID=2048003 RepID=UPI0013DAB916|nr:ABC transporter substrate-binding protein [Alteromonas flava]
MSEETQSRQAIRFAVNPSSVAQQELYHLLAQRFEFKYPNVKVKVLPQTLEAHKQRVINVCNGVVTDVDIMLAYAGTQLSNLIQCEKLAALDSLWSEQQLGERFPVSIQSVVRRNKHYFAIPMAYYQWGIYYRKSLFTQWNISPPHDWAEFVAVIQRLHEHAITPLSFSGGSSWSTLAWFDYLTLRLLGREHYLALLTGSAPFNSPQVIDVLQHWLQIIQLGAFDPIHAPLTWNGILPFFYRSKIAMMLNGNFFLAHVPESIKADIGFFPFPRLKTDMPRYEDAPTDVAVALKAAIDKPYVKEFMLFLAELDTQTFLAEYVGKIAPHNDFKPRDDFFLATGAEHLANADGLVQYFDRETNVEFTRAAGAIFVEFMQQSINVKETAEALEQAREKYLAPGIIQKND